MGKFRGDYRDVVEKVACWNTKAAISETRKDRGKVTAEGL